MMGPFIYCMATQAHDQMPDEISPNCCRWTRMIYSRGHLAIPMGHVLFRLSRNKQEQHERRTILNVLVIKKHKI